MACRVSRSRRTPIAPGSCRSKEAGTFCASLKKPAQSGRNLAASNHPETGCVLVSAWSAKPLQLEFTWRPLQPLWTPRSDTVAHMPATSQGRLGWTRERTGPADQPAPWSRSRGPAHNVGLPGDDGDDANGDGDAVGGDARWLGGDGFGRDRGRCKGRFRPCDGRRGRIFDGQRHRSPGDGTGHRRRTRPCLATRNFGCGDQTRRARQGRRAGSKDARGVPWRRQGVWRGGEARTLGGGISVQPRCPAAKGGALRARPRWRSTCTWRRLRMPRTGRRCGHLSKLCVASRTSPRRET